LTQLCLDGLLSSTGRVAAYDLLDHSRKMQPLTQGLVGGLNIWQDRILENKEHRQMVPILSGIK
jgi:hypothetical protein